MSAKATKYQGFGQLWEIWKVMEFPDIILISFWFDLRFGKVTEIEWIWKFFSSVKKTKWHLKIHIQACSILRKELVDCSCQPKKGMHGCWASWFNFLYQNLNIHTLHTGQGEFDWQSGTSEIDDNFLNSYDPIVSDSMVILYGETRSHAVTPRA